ncbi:MAG: M48 family metallopeptidase [Oscillospiraceae bacterium]|nr:M48 family metallopeptidase [Oscillospiraceae bacterium]
MIYTLTRSKRKTVALYIRDGDIEVRAPNRMPKREIDKFIASKQKWILDNIKLHRQREKSRERFSLDYGSTVVCCGKPRLITAISGKRIGFDDEQICLPADLSPEVVKRACIEVCKLIARQDLTEKTDGFARQLSVTPAAVKINNAKSRWGSCSSKKNINYSWRLILADDEVVDYVVVHELAHMLEMNHSNRFWAIVESILPDYRERRKRLKELQQRLSGEDWD